MPKKIKVGVAGCGYWGPNLIRNFRSLADCHLKMMCDLSTARLKHLKSLYPEVEAATDYKRMLNGINLDAVVIATNVKTHFPLAKAALLAGKHTFIEKPMAASVAQCEELVDIAKKGATTVMAALDSSPTTAAGPHTDVKAKEKEGDSAFTKGYEDNALKLAKAKFDALAAVTKEALAEGLRVAEDAHKKELMDDQAFYAKKVAVEQSNIDSEISSKGLERGILQHEMSVLAGTDLAKRNTLLAQLAKISGEVSVLELKRVDAARTGERDLADATEARTKKLAEQRITSAKAIADIEVSVKEEELRLMKALGEITDAQDLAQQAT